MVDGNRGLPGCRRTTATLPSQKPTCGATLVMCAVLLQSHNNNIQGLIQLCSKCIRDLKKCVFSVGFVFDSLICMNMKLVC